MKLGFIGLGVMGAPMCRNLAAKSGCEVSAFDLRKVAVEGVRAAATAEDAARDAESVFLSLPGGAEVEAVCRAVLPVMAPRTCIADLSTTPVSVARRLHAECAAREVEFVDAPVARTREAARLGTLSAMVGGSPQAYARLRPLLACMASDITRCGGPGTGQAMKLVNNLVLFQNVVAVAEALALAGKAGVEPALALEVLAKGSADSFALRNHGMKAMAPGDYPRQAYSTEYALKDLGYALELAREGGLELSGAQNARRLLEASRAAGFGAEYFPALAKIVAR
jgi:hypothetical protein